MGIGPVGAISVALKKAKLNFKDIQLVEINEAFAAQYLAVERSLGLNRNIANVNGGAIALGHPIGASGVLYFGEMAHHLKRKKGKAGLQMLCGGGGVGIATVIEAV